MRNAMVKLAAFALTLVLAHAVASADCAMWGLTAKVLNGDNQAFPADGGIIVAALPDLRGKLEKGDIAIHDDWRFRTGQGAMKPEISTYAPGLAVYHVPVTGPTDLEDGNQAIVATVKGRLDKRKQAEAPKVKSIVFDSTPSRRSVQRVVVELEAPPPAGTLALVLVDGRTYDPRSFGLTDATATVVPYQSRDCMALPNGTIPSKTGDKVLMYFVDGMGRISRPTKPMTIVAKP
jgi:hypothetical protein